MRTKIEEISVNPLPYYKKGLILGLIQLHLVLEVPIDFFILTFF